MQLNPYLNFNGNCEAAFKYYEQVLDGKIKMMLTYDAVPAEQVPVEWHSKKIIHAHLDLALTC